MPVAAKSLAHGKLIYRRLHRRYCRRRQRFGHVADTATDQALCGLGIRLTKLLHPPSDFREKVTRLELEIIFVQVSHGCWIFGRRRRYATGRGLAVNFRFPSRTTRRRADQVSSTAQTFVSTSPNGSANSRTTSSVTVVGRPALFFGHETQSMASSRIFLRSAGRSFASLHAFRAEIMNQVRLRIHGAKTNLIRQRAQQLSVIRWSPDRRHRGSRNDSQFLCQRLTRIASHDAVYHTPR